MKLISLTQGKFAKVDDDKFESLRKYKWSLFKDKSGNYYAHRGAWDSEKGRTYSVLMHREIMGCTKGDGKIIDHIDRDGLNCQVTNMRVATRGQNNANRKSSGSSKFLGVTNKKNGTFVAQIGSNKNRKHIGTFNSESEAAKAYNKEAAIRHGDFANLNILPG